MHTDEYEISLSREMAVCRKKVNDLQKKLARMEETYCMTTETFISRAHEGCISCEAKDFISWMQDYRAFRKWQGVLAEYEELFAVMKI